MPNSLAKSTAKLEHAETATIIGIFAKNAFDTISYETRPLTKSICAFFNWLFIYSCYASKPQKRMIKQL